jgi:hypothetical protein
VVAEGVAGVGVAVAGGVTVTARKASVVNGGVISVLAALRVKITCPNVALDGTDINNVTVLEEPSSRVTGSGVDCTVHPAGTLRTDISKAKPSVPV